MRRAEIRRLEAIWDVVKREPGIKPGRIAQRLGIPRSSITRALPALEENGYLISEDQKGRLWPWDRRC